MEIVQLYMKKRGIRFLAKTRKKLQAQISEDCYKYYWKKESFLAELARRENDYDVILITAHGAENSIIIPITQFDTFRQEYPERANERYKKYISVEETYFFKNNFVFAVSCLTAKELGPAVVENGVLAYLGYDVVIENLFNVSNINISSRVRKLYETIVKRIYVENLVLALTKFLDDLQNVAILKQWFAFHLEKSLIQFFNMSTAEIYNTYGLGIDENIWKKNRQKLQVQQLNFLGEINKHLIIIGDPNYISLYGIENKKVLEREVLERLKNVSFINKEYEKIFKEKLMDLIEVKDE